MAPVVKGELSDAEQKLMDTILKDGVQEVAALLKEPSVRVDCLDQTGMTPLQHAAFRGKTELCRLLLDHGADVNSDYHDNNYSTLHFAALSGNPEVTSMILEAGAKVDHINSVNRTAAQMAAFVGQHQCVRVINNFFPKQELERFTVPQGFEKEPKLPKHLLQPVLKLINLSTVHPVKVAMFLKENRELALEAYKVAKVLDIIVEESMKSRETNDPRAVKCHYFATIVRLANKSLKNSEDTLDAFLKSLVKGRDSDGFPETQERLIRQALKEFPYAESQLLQQLVRQIAPVKIVTYCNQTCQKLHWPTHKKFCKKMAAKMQEADLSENGGDAESIKQAGSDEDAGSGGEDAGSGGEDAGSGGEDAGSGGEALAASSGDGSEKVSTEAQGKTDSTADAVLESEAATS
ncbi:hypothetical protein BaRGS_00011186 [Batillaria attramentaria]|uniref:MYND-type domain-containing protein n=1 Tax=Batillaria attramentaria TaxID=370345 RepID=A0ABD0LDI6_9CAEN